MGWRIISFLFLTIVVTLALSFFVPSEMPYGTVPLLVGSILGGVVLLRLDGRGPGALGFYLAPSIGKEMVGGILLGVMVAGSVALGMVAFGALEWSPEVGTPLEYVREAGASLWFFTFPAAGEEALMRGYLLQALAESWGAAWGLWITSFLFGILHLGNPNWSWIGLANILMAGLFLGVVFLKTASLWWATGAHLGWNWAHGFILDLPVSGLELVDTPLYEPVTRGPEWLSGGSFGPEGSVLSTLVLCVVTLILWNTSWLQPGVRAKEVRPLILSGKT